MISIEFRWQLQVSEKQLESEDDEQCDQEGVKLHSAILGLTRPRLLLLLLKQFFLVAIIYRVAWLPSEVTAFNCCLDLRWDVLHFTLYIYFICNVLHNLFLLLLQAQFFLLLQYWLRLHNFILNLFLQLLYFFFNLRCAHSFFSGFPLRGNPLRLQLIPLGVLGDLINGVFFEPLEEPLKHLLAFLRALLPHLQALSKERLVLPQVLLVAVELDDGVDLAAVPGDELSLVQLQPILELGVYESRQLLFRLLESNIFSFKLLSSFPLQIFDLLLFGSRCLLLGRFLDRDRLRFLFGECRLFILALAILIEHELEPLFFLLPVLINLFLDAMHLLNQGGILRQLVGLVEVVEAQFYVLALLVDELQIGLRLLIVPLGRFPQFQGLISAVYSVFFLVELGEA